MQLEKALNSWNYQIIYLFLQRILNKGQQVCIIITYLILKISPIRVFK